MYLIIREDGQKKRPIKAYRNIDDAINYIKTYVQESKHKWHYIKMQSPKRYNIRYFCDTKEYRKWLYIMPMKLI